MEAILEGWKRVECLAGAVEVGGAAVQGSSQFVGLKTGCWSFGDALRFPQVGKIPNFPSRELRRSFSEHKSEL